MSEDQGNRIEYLENPWPSAFFCSGITQLKRKGIRRFWAAPFRYLDDGRVEVNKEGFWKRGERLPLVNAKEWDGWAIAYDPGASEDPEGFEYLIPSLRRGQEFDDTAPVLLEGILEDLEKCKALPRDDRGELRKETQYAILLSDVLQSIKRFVSEVPEQKAVLEATAKFAIYWHLLASLAGKRRTRKITGGRAQGGMTEKLEGIMVEWQRERGKWPSLKELQSLLSKQGRLLVNRSSASKDEWECQVFGEDLSWGQFRSRVREIRRRYRGN